MSNEVETIIINSLDKLENKIDKIEDSVNDVKGKVMVMEERHNSDRASHSAHEAMASDLKNTLESHIVLDNNVQAKIFSELKTYNKLLDIHIEGVNTLKDLHLQNAEKIDLYKTEMNARLGVLEAPIKAKEYFYKKYIKIGGIITLTSAVIVAVSKITGLF